MLGRQRTVAQVKRDITRTKRNLSREEFWLRMMDRFRFLGISHEMTLKQKAVVTDHMRELIDLEDELVLMGGVR